MKRLLVTGSSGFVGARLMQRLAVSGHAGTTAGRAASRAPHAANWPHAVVGDIGPATDWSGVLDRIDTVVHLAAQVPARGVADARYDAVNNLGTAGLCQQAAMAGVRRVIFVSTVFAAIPGEISGDVPDTPYGRSKRAAERHVAAFASPGRVGLSLRAPLIYGEDAGGNWALLMRLAALPAPLPFGAVQNRRSLIAVDNLADAILRVIDTPDVDTASGTYALADGEPVSLINILAWLRSGMNRPRRLFRFPPGLIGMALKAAGQGKAAQSLLGDMAVDPTRFRSAFKWVPPVGTEDAIKAAGALYLERKNLDRH